MKYIILECDHGRYPIIFPLGFVFEDISLKFKDPLVSCGFMCKVGDQIICYDINNNIKYEDTVICNKLFNQKI